MITVIDYKAGNLTSVKLAFESLGIDARITRDPAEVLKAERIVFPGVGAAGAAMSVLESAQLLDAIREVVRRGLPFLGICVGCQILLDRSEEDGGVDTIGVLPGTVKRFPDPDVNGGDKVPHMGWNAVHFKREHPLFAEIPQDAEFYFVHSYYPAPTDPTDALGETHYAGITFSSALARSNVVATQFHVEKSGRVGLKVLENFSTWDGATC